MHVTRLVLRVLAISVLAACGRDIAGESVRRSFERADVLGIRRESTVRVRVVRVDERTYRVELPEAGLLSGCVFPAHQDAGAGFIALDPNTRCTSSHSDGGKPLVFEVHSGHVQVDGRGRFGSISGGMRRDGAGDAWGYNLYFGTTLDGPDGKFDLR
jgi:hypothetical protein